MICIWYLCYVLTIIGLARAPVRHSYNFHRDPRPRRSPGPVRRSPDNS